MRIIFFGTADFAVPALRTLATSKHKVLGVVTALDSRKGRGRKLRFSPVKALAQKNLALFQPADLRDNKLIQFLNKERCDLFVVCAYGKILTKEILQVPKIYALNLHASLLPKYRGAAPINWAIIRGEGKSGVTVFKMDEYMDKGEIILQKQVAILRSDTAVNLAEKLADIGSEVLLDTIDLIEQGRATFTAQDEEQASLAPKLKKEDGLIDWQSPAIEIHNRIRGLQPWPGAFTYFGNKLLKIWESKIIPSAAEKRTPGEIADVHKKRGILVQTGKARLLITVLQLEGKGRMPAAEFILGHSIKTGEKLGK